MSLPPTWVSSALSARSRAMIRRQPYRPYCREADRADTLRQRCARYFVLPAARPFVTLGEGPAANNACLNR